MADIIAEVSLPSRGILYEKEIIWNNQLRAPRLRDKGLADTTRKFKLQANILDNTLSTPLGISTYDLHVADFTYLNLIQRQLAKGAQPYSVLVKCGACGKLHKVEIDLSTLDIKAITSKPEYIYETGNESIRFTFVTPRIIEESIINAQEFRNEYPDADQSDDTLKTQEFLRLLIKEIDGRRLTYPQMTDFIGSMYISDIDQLIYLAGEADWGIQLQQELTCDCGKVVVYSVPIG